MAASFPASFCSGALQMLHILLSVGGERGWRSIFPDKSPKEVYPTGFVTKEEPCCRSPQDCVTFWVRLAFSVYFIMTAVFFPSSFLFLSVNSVFDLSSYLLIRYPFNPRPSLCCSSRSEGLITQVSVGLCSVGLW